MKLNVVLFACSLPLTACDQGETDIGELPGMTDGATGGVSETDPSETDPSETGSTTEPLECAGAGELCLDGCCEGFGCNFANECEACTPEGEYRGVDGSGCCEGLETRSDLFCYASQCPGGVCPEGVSQCAPLVADGTGQGGFVEDCAAEACVGEAEFTFNAAPGLECTGPMGSDACAAVSPGLQFFTYTDDNLSLTVSFDPAILDGYSTEAFNEHLNAVEGQLTIPGASVPLIAFVGANTPSDLTYAEGRLQFTVPVALDNAFDTIESDAEDCLSDDIQGICSCFYEDLGVFNLVIDLAIEAP